MTATNVARAARVRRIITTVPLVGVNTVAVGGQLVALTGLGVPWPLAVGVAAVVESVALFLSFHAHLAALAGDAATRLRLGAYLVGAGVGVLNASHWIHAPGGATFAWIFGGASILSPWLWGIHTRREHRDQLHDMGLVDQRTARFSMSRWLWFPTRTFRAHRWAVWYSECDPARAVARSGVLGPGEAKHAPAPVISGATNVAPDVAPAETYVAPDESYSETTYTGGVLDAAVLMASTPPPWEGVSKTDAVLRAGALLPGRDARKLSRALTEVGVDVSPQSVRSIRSRIRKKAES